MIFCVSLGLRSPGRCLGTHVAFLSIWRPNLKLSQLQIAWSCQALPDWIHLTFSLECPRLPDHRVWKTVWRQRGSDLFGTEPFVPITISVDQNPVHWEVRTLIWLKLSKTLQGKDAKRQTSRWTAFQYWHFFPYSGKHSSASGFFHCTTLGSVFCNLLWDPSFLSIFSSFPCGLHAFGGFSRAVVFLVQFLCIRELFGCGLTTL